MLSGKGNENGEKTTIGLISKKATLHMQHIYGTFLCPCFARLQRKTSRNFLVTRFVDEMSNVVRQVFLFTFFHSRSFLSWWPLALLIFSPALQNFHVVLPTKKMSSLLFFSSASSLSLFFSLSFAGLSPTFSVFFFSVFLFLYLSILWT